MTTPTSKAFFPLRRRLARAVLFLLAIFLLVLSSKPRCSRDVTAKDLPHGLSRSQLASAYGRLPLCFERNAGQMDPRVQFLARGGGYTLLLTRREAVLRLHASPAAAHRGLEAAMRSTQLQLPQRPQESDLRIGFVGANPQARVEGMEIQPGHSNYFIGNDASKWRTEVPLYARVRYAGIYPGADLVFYGNPEELESDFVFAAGADPQAMALRITGATRISLERNGDARLETGAGSVILRRPDVYQERNGTRSEVAANYVRRGPNEIGIRVESYDRALPLVVDPALSYSTFLGGSSFDQGKSIAVDSMGNAYITGQTKSTNFPTLSPLPGQTGLNSPGGDAFVTKLNATGTKLVYSTYLGGTGLNGDTGTGIAVDSSGNAYIAGDTTSSDFPVTAGSAFQSADPNSQVATFLTKLDPTGTLLLYSTYLAGNTSDHADDVAVDASANAYVTGGTFSTNFPVTPGAFQNGNSNVHGGSTAFLSRIDTTRSGTPSLVYSTYLGGSGNATNTFGDDGVGVAVDSNSVAYVTGKATSADFPVTTTPSFPLAGFQTTLKSLNGNGFVAKIDTTQAGNLSMIYSTFLGGSGNATAKTGDTGVGIALDSKFNVFVTGEATSTDFPTTSGAFQTTGNAKGKAFVARLDTTKSGSSSLVYSTFLGGTGGEGGNAIAVDSQSDAAVTGFTFSTDFPTTSGAVQTALKSSKGNGFVSTLNPQGSGLLFSTYLGGSGATGDVGFGITLDSATPQNAYVTGRTSSSDFPTTSGVFQTSLKGTSNAFVAKLLAVPDFTISASPTSATVTAGSATTFTVTVTSVNGFNSAVSFSCSGNPADSSCSFSPSSVTPPANGSATSTLTIATTMRTVTAPPPSAPPSRPAERLLLWSLAGLAFSLFAASLCTRSRTSRLAGALAVLSLVLLASCSSHHGTPAGTFTVTVTGTSGSIIHTTTLSLTVN